LICGSRIIKGDVACVIIEPIQGVGGLDREPPIFQALEKCKANDVVLILDEVQSGFEEAGSSHQYHDIKPDIICMAKGMGNGFPIGGI
jgi:acetylornithine aminotransferase